MNRSKSTSVVIFIYTHCIKNYLCSLFFVFCAAVYWACDLQFRNWIFKEILERFEAVPRESALSAMQIWIYVYFISFLLRFFILRFSSYVRMYYIPLMKINLMKFLIGEVLLKSNVLIKKELDIISNQIQELLRNCLLVIEKVCIDFSAHLVLLISPFYIFYGHSLLIYGMLFLYLSFFLVSYVGYKRGVKLNANVVSFDMILFSRFNDVFSNLLNVKLCQNYMYEQKELEPFFKKFEATSVEKDWWYLILNGFLSVVFILYHCFCLVFLIWQYQSGFISKAYFPYIISNNKEITEALWCVLDDFTTLSEAIGKITETLKRILSDTYLLEAKLEKPNLFSFDISFENILFSYHNKEVLFDNFSLFIKEGDKVGIVGPSGSGKSSLAGLLLNLVSVQSGEIKIGGYNIDLISHSYLHSLITYMNQDLCLFNRTIRENIVYSRLDVKEDDMINAAKMANIHEFIEGLPNGYDTLVEFRGKEFSYGEKQRILIARAFLRDTPILILDEVTSSLDSKSEYVVMESLHKLMKGKTVLVIAHKIKTLVDMDYLIVMNHGKIIEIGSHDKLIEKRNLYYELVQI